VKGGGPVVLTGREKIKWKPGVPNKIQRSSKKGGDHNHTRGGSYSWPEEEKNSRPAKKYRSGSIDGGWPQDEQYAK